MWSPPNLAFPQYSLFSFSSLPSFLTYSFFFSFSFSFSLSLCTWCAHSTKSSSLFTKVVFLFSSISFLIANLSYRSWKEKEINRSISRSPSVRFPFRDTRPKIHRRTYQSANAKATYALYNIHTRKDGRMDGRTYRDSPSVWKSPLHFLHTAGTTRTHLHTSLAARTIRHLSIPLSISLTLSHPIFLSSSPSLSLFLPSPSLSFSPVSFHQFARRLSLNQPFSRSLSGSLSRDRLHVQPVGLYMSNDVRKPSPSLSLSIFFSLQPPSTLSLSLAPSLTHSLTHSHTLTHTHALTRSLTLFSPLQLPLRLAYSPTPDHSLSSAATESHVLSFHSNHWFTDDDDGTKQFFSSTSTRDSPSSIRLFHSKWPIFKHHDEIDAKIFSWKNVLRFTFDPSERLHALVHPGSSSLIHINPMIPPRLRGRLLPDRGGEYHTGDEAHSWPAGPPSSVNSHSQPRAAAEGSSWHGARHLGHLRHSSALSVAFNAGQTRVGTMSEPRPDRTIGMEISCQTFLANERIDSDSDVARTSIHFESYNYSISSKAPFVTWLLRLFKWLQFKKWMTWEKFTRVSSQFTKSSVLSSSRFNVLRIKKNQINLIDQFLCGIVKMMFNKIFVIRATKVKIEFSYIENNMLHHLNIYCSRYIGCIYGFETELGYVFVAMLRRSLSLRSSRFLEEKQSRGYRLGKLEQFRDQIRLARFSS